MPETFVEIPAHPSDLMESLEASHCKNKKMKSIQKKKRSSFVIFFFSQELSRLRIMHKEWERVLAVEVHHQFVFELRHGLRRNPGTQLQLRARKHRSVKISGFVEAARNAMHDPGIDLLLPVCEKPHLQMETQQGHDRHVFVQAVLNPMMAAQAAETIFLNLRACFHDIEHRARNVVLPVRFHDIPDTMYKPGDVHTFFFAIQHASTRNTGRLDTVGFWRDHVDPARILTRRAFCVAHCSRLEIKSLQTFDPFSPYRDFFYLHNCICSRLWNV